MGHLHFPDGFLPFWLWGAGFVVTALITAYVLYRIRHQDTQKKIPLIGVMAAVMIVGMSFEIVPLAYHINLAIPVGILLGPGPAFIAALATNIFLALLGHGGITTIGLNTLIIGGEAFLGWLFFRIFASKKIDMRIRVFICSFVALLITHSVVLFSLAAIMPGSIHAPSSEGKIISFEPFGEKEAPDTSSTPTDNAALIRFLLPLLGLSILGSILESIIGALLINYLSTLKPDLIEKA